MSYRDVTSSTNTGLNDDMWKCVASQIRDLLNKPHINNEINKKVLENNIKALLISVSEYGDFVDIGFYTHLDKFTIAPKNDSTFALMCKIGLY